MSRKKLFVLIVILALILPTSLVMAKGGKPGGGSKPENPGGGNGGGHTETATNNQSFPAILADGASVTPITETKFEVVYEGPYTGLTAEDIAFLEANGPWYAQKVEGNVWQADYALVDSVSVYFVDWGDAMESVDPKIGRPYRLELGLYAQLAETMTAYTMAELAFPSSNQETQGTNTTMYESYYATIATPMGKLVVQRYEPDAVLTWNAEAGQWDGAYAPETGFGFQQELNVGGKFIFGASTGGWKPSVLGEYRITFFFEAGSGVSLSAADVGDYNAGNPIIPKEGENNTAVVDTVLNITYIDVTAIGSGGGGGGGNH